MRNLISKFMLAASFAVVLAFASFASAQQQKLSPLFGSAPATDASGKGIGPIQAAGESELQTFTYTTTSSRDGNSYTGVMVGTTPFGADFPSTTVNTVIIPVVLTTNTIATHVAANLHVLTTKQGVTVFDPTSPDNACLKSPNNVPVAVFQQSPIFQSAPFSVGPTDVGTTQYTDAFQRGNFWNFVGGTGYHTLVSSSPVVLAPVSINLPGDQGMAVPAAIFGGCGPLAIADYRVMLGIFNSVLEATGFNTAASTAQFPILLFYNTVMSGSSPNDLKDCCFLGFHAAVSQQPGDRVQTYAFIDFDMTGDFGPAVSDTSVASHEVAEWMDDPFGNNPTPAWGHTGQVGKCQENLEVGDPLSGTMFPNVTGANGFTYHLQELAFFSWFYGAPSIAANGWFSDNNTFTTDAGPVCK